MVLSKVWIGLFTIGILVGAIQLIFFGDVETLPKMMDDLFVHAKNAFEMSLGLTGMLTFWMGVMKIGEHSGVVTFLARIISPVLIKLFPDIPKGHPAFGALFLNMSANMLGLDNAATPMGLKAMQELQSLNHKKDTASNAMIMFLVLNTSGLTIIPISIIAYRTSNGATDPTDIFLPLLLVTMCSTFIGLFVCALIQRINIFQREFVLLFCAVCLFVLCLLFSIKGMNNYEVQTFCRVLTSVLIFGVILFILLSGMKKKINVYDSFIDGAKDGFKVAVSLIPYIVAILTAISVFQTSGCMGWLQGLVMDFVRSFGLDTSFVDALPVAILKPFSGPGARGIMLQIFSLYGPDSFTGHLASLFQGSTDTTFYILAVYFGSVGIKKYRYSLLCGLIADVAGFIAAIFVCYLFF